MWWAAPLFLRTPLAQHMACGNQGFLNCEISLPHLDTNDCCISNLHEATSCSRLSPLVLNADTQKSVILKVFFTDINQKVGEFWKYGNQCRLIRTTNVVLFG